MDRTNSAMTTRTGRASANQSKGRGAAAYAAAMEESSRRRHSQHMGALSGHQQPRHQPLPATVERSRRAQQGKGARTYDEGEETDEDDEDFVDDEDSDEEEDGHDDEADGEDGDPTDGTDEELGAEEAGEGAQMSDGDGEESVSDAHGRGDDDDDDDDDADLNQMGDISMKQALKVLAGAAKSQTHHNKKMAKLIMRAMRRNGAAAAGGGGQYQRRTAPRGRRGPAAPARRALLADGLPRLFGPGHRKTVAKVIAAAWFKDVAAPSLLIPYNNLVQVIMPKFNFDPADADDRTDFDGSYRGEASRVQSKEKNRLSNLFLDGLLTLNSTPIITEASSATPTNMPVHLIKFPLLKNPLAGLDANDPRRKYMNSWHAEMVNGNALAFAKLTVRKLFQIDFFARAKLEPEAEEWALGNVAYFVVFTNQAASSK